MEPNRELALELYRRMAPKYDRRGAKWPFAGLRRRAVNLLHLERGHSVLDVGCGTGLAFPILEEAIGTEGHIIGIDQSPDMLAKARARVEANGWENVTLIQSRIEEASIPQQVDAALFAFSHDIARSPVAVGNVVRHLKPGGRVAVVGVTWGPWWALPFNLIQWLTLRRGATTYEGLGRPWSNLQKLIPGLQVTKPVVRLHYGSYYFARGERR
ncbi:MAG: methyltransferase domain-containing protein [Chloroflexi bacterium]|nr:methyltransferase domain-containing protein [Chloroflexota bacterium]